MDKLKNLSTSTLGGFMPHRPRASLLTVSAAVTIALIAGCSSPGLLGGTAVEPAPAEQTVTEACNEILGPIVALGQQMQGLEENAASDPQSVVDGFAASAADLADVTASISNPEVKSTLETAVATLEGLSTSLQSIIDDPENADYVTYQELLNTVVDDFSAIDTVCGG